MTEIIIAPSYDITHAAARISPEDAVRLWLAGYRSPNTRRAYRGEIEAFARFVGRPAGEAAAAILALDDSQAHTLVDAYRAHMLQKGMSGSSINRSMASLNSFVRSARRHGLTTLRLEAQSVKAERYRDTRGPGTGGVQKMLAVARAQYSPSKAARDVAILRLLFGLGLRRAELVACNLADLDRGGAVLSIIGKGESSKRGLSVPPAAMAALYEWIRHRGEHQGPLFCPVDRPRQRLTGSGVYYLVRDMGAQIGIKTRPHGVRHAAITAVLDATNGDMRKAQAFGRHASASTTVTYDDNRQDLSGSAARILDALVE